MIQMFTNIHSLRPLPHNFARLVSLLELCNAILYPATIPMLLFSFITLPEANIFPQVTSARRVHPLNAFALSLAHTGFRAEFFGLDGTLLVVFQQVEIRILVSGERGSDEFLVFGEIIPACAVHGDVLGEEAFEDVSVEVGFVPAVLVRPVELELPV